MTGYDRDNTNLNYEDIINLPHPVSKRHKPMPVEDRAAQFAPFAALSGHGEAIAETARLTEGKIELDDYEKLKLDEKVYILQERIAEVPTVCITYFRPDTKKNGGAYLTISQGLKKICPQERLLVMADDTKIRMEDILELSFEQIF